MKGLEVQNMLKPSTEPAKPGKEKVSNRKFSYTEKVRLESTIKH